MGPDDIEEMDKIVETLLRELYWETIEGNTEIKKFVEDNLNKFPVKIASQN